jgi:hypothetical protein
LLGDVVRVGGRLQPVGGGEPEELVHQQPLRRRPEPMAAVLGQQRQADLVAAARRAAAVLRPPARDAGDRAVGQDHRHRRGLGADEPVPLPAAAPRPRVPEADPLEGPERRRVGVQPLQEPEVVLAEHPEGEVAVHMDILVQKPRLGRKQSSSSAAVVTWPARAAKARI